MFHLTGLPDQMGFTGQNGQKDLRAGGGYTNCAKCRPKNIPSNSHLTGCRCLAVNS